MREPNVKELMEALAAGDFIEKIFKYRETADTEIAQFLYFMQKEQAAALYAEICQMDEEEKKPVLVSLSELYPLSKHIVFYLLKKFETTPWNFLNIYDMDKALLQSIQQTLGSIKGNSNAVSLLFNQYQDEIEKENGDIGQLRDEIENLNNVSIQVSEKREEKRRLQEELDKLHQELVPENLDTDIQKLQEEIEELYLKKEEKIRQKENLEGELKNIKEDLQRQDNDFAQAHSKGFLSIAKFLKSKGEKR